MSLGRTWIQVNTSYNVLGCCWCTPRVWRWYPHSIPNLTHQSLTVQVFQRSRFKHWETVRTICSDQQAWWLALGLKNDTSFLNVHAIKYHKIFFVVSQPLATCNSSPSSISNPISTSKWCGCCRCPPGSFESLSAFSKAQHIASSFASFSSIVLWCGGWMGRQWVMWGVNDPLIAMEWNC